MKRLALLLAVAVAFALPSGAAAGTATFKGKLATGGTVSFELKRKPDGRRKVVDWRWHNLPITCAKGGEQAFDGQFKHYPLKVTKRSFHGRAVPDKPGREGFAEVFGSFPNDWGHSSGTFQVSGDTSVGQDCESGVVNWSATKR